MDLEELLATRLLVQGNSGSGKSHLLRRLLEQSANAVQQAVIDPEGDFVTLADRFGHVVVDATVGEADLARIALRVRQHRVSVVLTLEGLDVEAQMRCAAAFLGGLFEADRDVWYPMLVAVDEARAAAAEEAESAAAAAAILAAPACVSGAPPPPPPPSGSTPFSIPSGSIGSGRPSLPLTYLHM
jgi:DNA helicase HerA-like ATPase